MTGPSVALIACANGLGHLRRQAMLATALAERGACVTLYCREAAYRRLQSRAPIGQAVEVTIADFDTGTSADALRRGDPFAAQWETRLPDPGHYDAVISDNLPEILARRADAILVGHFFWHEAIPDAAPDYVARARALVAAARPAMIATGVFAAPYLAAQTRLHRVGLFGAKHVAAPGSAKAERDLLISCGTGEVDGETGALVMRLAAGPPPPFDKVHVDPQLLPPHPPRWMCAAEYTPAMYASLCAAVIRPGIGTVTDCLLAGAPVFAFGEDDNQEIRANARRIAELGVGIDCASAQEAFEQALIHADSAQAQECRREAAARLPAHGEAQAADIVLEIASLSAERHIDARSMPVAR